MPALLEPLHRPEVVRPDLDVSSFEDLFTTAMEDVEFITHQAGNVDVVKVNWCQSVAGPLLIGVYDRCVRFVHFAQAERLTEQLTRLQQQLVKPFRNAVHPLHDQLEAEVEEYCEGKRKTFSLPLKPAGTLFQQRVWQALQRIPYGTTWSYEQLATEIGQPTASRAVGLANGANPIAILIPCHRVINKNGQLGGYGGGQWRKERLLNLEKQNSCS